MQCRPLLVLLLVGAARPQYACWGGEGCIPPDAVECTNANTVSRCQGHAVCIQSPAGVTPAHCWTHTEAIARGTGKTYCSEQIVPGQHGLPADICSSDDDEYRARYNVVQCHAGAAQRYCRSGKTYVGWQSDAERGGVCSVTGNYINFRTGGSVAPGGDNDIVSRSTLLHQGDKVTVTTTSGHDAGNVEEYPICGDKIKTPHTTQQDYKTVSIYGQVRSNGDIEWSHGYTSRPEQPIKWGRGCGSSAGCGDVAVAAAIGGGVGAVFVVAAIAVLARRRKPPQVQPQQPQSHAVAVATYVPQEPHKQQQQQAVATAVVVAPVAAAMGTTSDNTAQLVQATGPMEVAM